MGRRKQANPTKVAEESEACTSQQTTTNNEEVKNGEDKKASINFSISSHLQSDSKKARKSQNGSSTNDSNTNISYLAAQKAYQTLMSNLKQQESMMKSMGFANNNTAAAAFFMNPFFGAGMSPFDFFSTGLQSNTGKKRSKLEEDPAAVDLSIKKKRSAEVKPTPKSNDASSNSALDKLSTLVTTVGNSPSPINTMMRTQNSNFNQSDSNNDATRVFTCLQCLEKFQSMQELAEHMGKTMHFNQLKSFNSSLNPTKHKTTTNSPAKSPSPIEKKASSRGGTFSFECLLCGHSSSGSIDEHMKTSHSFNSPNDWISAVKLIPL